MKFEPIENIESMEIKKLEPGKYEFEVIEAEETVSRSGKDMVKVNLQLQTFNGSSVRCYDFLLPNAVPWKFYTFLKSLGLKGYYANGEISLNDLIGKMGEATFSYEEYNGKEYIKPKRYHEKEEQENIAVEDGFNDDIPF